MTNQTAQQETFSKMNSKPELLTRRDIAARLGGCSQKTVVRFERQFGLQAVSYIGLEPVFDPADVLKAEARRISHRRKTLARMAAGGPRRKDVSIISTKEAKRRAGK
jgi:hypothetical protein